MLNECSFQIVIQHKKIDLLTMKQPKKMINCRPTNRCVTSAFGDEPRQILRIIQRFDKHFSCHLQGEYVVVGRFCKPYIGQDTARSSAPPISTIKSNPSPTTCPDTLDLVALIICPLFIWFDYMFSSFMYELRKNMRGFKFHTFHHSDEGKFKSADSTTISGGFRYH
jgi:hypothetical protein